MKKKITLFLMALCAMVGSANATYDFYSTAPSGQRLYYKITGYSVKVTYPGSRSSNWDGFTMPTGNLTIPSSVSYNGHTYQITAIDSLAFHQCSSITSVVIPNTVTTISYGAFAYCRGITTVTIPTSVTSIEGLAFDYCSSLATLNYNAINCSIQNDAFYGSNAITTVLIGNDVQTIPSNFMYGKTNLTTLTIGNSVETIGRGAFSGCTGLTIVAIDNPVETIEGYAFSDCSNLYQVSLPNTLTTIGDGAFENCYRLSDLNFPNSVTSVGSEAFMNCPLPLTYNNTIFVKGPPYTTTGDYVIPAGITTICDYAFYSRYLLSSISIPNTVTTIGKSAFGYCRNLTQITLPDSVDSLGDYLFANCSTLTTVNIPSGISCIPQGMFTECPMLTTITIPNNITSIGSNAFFRSGLQQITIPSSVKSIGSYVFCYCPNLGSFDLPNTVTSLGYGVFMGCENLSEPIYNNALFAYLPSSYSGEYTIPYGIKNICTNSFYGCSNLTSVTIPASVDSIGDYAFYNCSSLQELWFLSIEAPDINSDSYYNCNTNITIYIPFGSKSNYSSVSRWPSYSSKIKEGILLDGSTYTNTTEMTNAKVKYSRTFAPGVWVPLFVPFSSSASVWADSNFTIAELTEVTTEGNCDVLNWQIVSGTMEANHPYIIRYNGTEPYDFDHIFSGCSVASSDLSSASIIKDNGLTSDDARRYTLTGTYEEKTYTSGEEWYAMGGGNFWPAGIQNGVANTLLPQRFYLTITDPNKQPGEEGYYKSAPQGGTIIRVGEDNVGIIRPDGSVELPTDEHYYDLLGRRVGQPQKGHIYIHNHKKIIY